MCLLSGDSRINGPDPSPHLTWLTQSNQLISNTVLPITMVTGFKAHRLYNQTGDVLRGQLWWGCMCNLGCILLRALYKWDLGRQFGAECLATASNSTISRKSKPSVFAVGLVKTMTRVWLYLMFVSSQNNSKFLANRINFQAIGWKSSSCERVIDYFLII